MPYQHKYARMSHTKPPDKFATPITNPLMDTDMGMDMEKDMGMDMENIIKFPSPLILVATSNKQTNNEVH